MMPREYRSLVLPSQLCLPTKQRYIPAFNSQTHRCWWEPLVRENPDEWIIVDASKKTRKQRVQHQEDPESDLEEDEIQQLPEQTEEAAWEAFWRENKKRESLAEMWMNKHM
jgi:hypothetical protein